METNELDTVNESIRTRKGEEGFSVAEVVIAMVIFLGVTGSIWGLMQTALRARSATSENVNLTKTVRLGLNLIGRDTYNAGLGYPAPPTAVVLPDNKLSTLLGIPADPDSTRDTIRPIVAGNNITLNTFNMTPGVRTDQVTILYRDTAFNRIPSALPVDRWIPQPLRMDLVTKTGTYTQLRSSTGSNSACAVNDIYLVTGSNGENRLGVATSLVSGNSVRFTDGDALGFNLGTTSDSIEGITGQPSIQKVQMITYHVTADGTLMRREYMNRASVPASGWVDEPLVYGVENFQIQYVMNDGTVTDDPGANGALIRQIRFTVSVRSTEVGSNNQPYRETMTATFSTRNLGYDAN